MAQDSYPHDPAPPPYMPPDSESFSTATHCKWRNSVVCSKCGQLHEPNGTHLYDYHQAVDEDLTCHICLQPLVRPTDTKCGHTYCSRCLKNYLRLQKQCPLDRQPLTVSECQQSSVLVRRLLDKLLVVCPNVDYCEEVLPRSELDAHLAHRCRGAVTKCIKSSLGCTFQGPRSALQSHLWECPHRDQQSGKNPIVPGDVSTIEIPRKQPDLGISIVGGCDTPLACVVVQGIFPEGEVARDGRLQPGDQILEVNGEDLMQVSHYHARKMLALYYPVCRLTVYREKAEEERPIEKEEILKITLHKSKCRQLGIKLVGKRLGTGVYILNLVPNSLAALDGRLLADDRVLEINGSDVSYSTQDQAAQIIQIPHESLGISIAGGVCSPRGDTPVYVTNINLKGCLGLSGQVKRGDILLSINGTSLLGLTHADAVAEVKMNTESKVVTLRLIEAPETSDGPGNFVPSWLFWQQLPRMCQSVRTVTLLRSPSGSLGFSVVGGVDCIQGSLPIYIKSVVLETPAFKDGRLKCGDLILTVNETSLEAVAHARAVEILKQATGAVSLSVVSWPGTIV